MFCVSFWIQTYIRIINRQYQSFDQWTLYYGLSIAPPPILDTGALIAVVTGMLGIGIMRSYDKTQGTNTDSISSVSNKEIRLKRRLARLEAKKL